MKQGVWAIALWAGAAVAAGAQAAPMVIEHHEAKEAVRSTALAVTVDGKTTTVTLAELEAMPQRALTVRNGHSGVDEMYTGVGTDVLLAKFGLTLEGPGAKRVYHSYLKAEGTDKYWVFYSATELEAGMRTTEALVALRLNGKALEADGAFKLVVAGEKKPARWVRNLAGLTVVTVE